MKNIVYLLMIFCVGLNAQISSNPSKFKNGIEITGGFLDYVAPIGTSTDTIAIFENDILKRVSRSNLGFQLNDFSDVSIVGLFDGAVLKYNNTSGFWELGTDQAGGATGATQLNELSDVSVASPSNRFALMGNGTTFASRALVEADITDFGSYQAAGSYASGSHLHDERYFTETESDARFLGINDPVASAAVLGTARIIALGGDLSGSASFDGSANITITGVVADDSHIHDTRYFTETESDARFLAIGSNAASASVLQTARTISLAGDLSGSASFNGGSNITITGVVADDSHLHNGTYFTETESDARFLAIGSTAANSNLLDGLDSSEFIRNNVSSGTYFDGIYLSFGGSGTNNDFISFNDTTNAFYFNADGSRQNTSGNASVYASSFVGSLSGNATSATTATTASTLATSRTISLAGDLSGSASFNGGSNITITGVVADDSHFHDTRYFTETESNTNFVNASGNDSASGIISFTNGTNSTNRDTGAIVITTGGLGVEGNINAGGDITAFSSSDKRLKKYINPIQDPIGKLKRLKGVSFDWNNRQNLYSGSDIGVIAQDVQKVFPSAVRKGTSGFLQVQYEKLIPVLIEAVKAQEKEIQELKKMIKKL